MAVTLAAILWIFLAERTSCEKAYITVHSQSIRQSLISHGAIYVNISCRLVLCATRALKRTTKELQKKYIHDIIFQKAERVVLKKIAKQNNKRL